MNHRIPTIDFIRGLAIILMIFNHFFSLLDAKLNTKYSNHFCINIIGGISRTLFIFLLGFSFKLSQKNKNYVNKNIYKALQLLCYSFIINIITYLIYPEKYVRFGILHFLSISLLLLLLLEKIHFSTPLFAGILLYFIYIFVLLKHNTNNIVLSSIGVHPKYSTMDYFPICKWFWLVSLGFFVSHNVNNFKYQNNNPLFNLISKIGQKSLYIYMLHFPCLFFLHKYLDFY